MGFGFNLFFIFILLPLTVLLVLVWAGSGKIIFGKILLGIWAGIISLVLFVGMVNFLGPKPYLDKDDFYGQYVIDRNQYPGKQADWQYKSFKF
ncbi:hypothetical protein ACFQ48_10165 [Hymenobacter caeli]|uniref:Uncharacterized protein n=1 Tax=Hymenobacter caeli TaxID=2735894 RepID=A0ABX2FS66_9BACT|nr:hypothetical protein [Hymenobacter caeli]NRT19792.1 hypothetical protein [Hymenobacter caeli]